MLGRQLVKAFSPDWDVKGVDIQDFDITDSRTVREWVASCRPDFILNSAAYTDVDGCEEEVDHAFKVNALGVKNLALAAREVGAEILQVSTDFVFDGSKKDPYTEFDRPNPISVYGASKWWGEIYLRDFSSSFTIVRTQWLYGPGGKNFVDTILRLAREKKELRVVDDQFGSPTSTVELAAGIRRLVNEGTYGIYHLSNNGSCSWLEFARAILEIAGFEGIPVVPISSEELSRPAKRPRNSVLRNYHLELTIGDSMKHWREPLEEYIRSQGDPHERTDARA